jgi:hypothetical protein
MPDKNSAATNQLAAPYTAHLLDLNQRADFQMD